MLYLRLSSSRVPTLRPLLKGGSLYLRTAAGSYNINSTLVPVSRVNPRRAQTFRVNVQAPGSGGGKGSITNGSCYGGSGFVPGASGGNGAAGFFWAADISKTTALTGVITVGAAGLGGGNVASSPNIHGGCSSLWYEDTGGLVGGGVGINFTGIVFTLPSGGAGGAGGKCLHRNDGRFPNATPPTAGANGASGTAAGGVFNLGLSGKGGDSSCYSRAPFYSSCYGGGWVYDRKEVGQTPTARGTTLLPSIGTVISPSAGTPRNIPAHSVALFTTNLYGQGGLGGLAATTASTRPTIIAANHGNVGAFQLTAIPTAFKF